MEVRLLVHSVGSCICSALGLFYLQPGATSSSLFSCLHDVDPNKERHVLTSHGHAAQVLDLKFCEAVRSVRAAASQAAERQQRLRQTLTLTVAPGAEMYFPWTQWLAGAGHPEGRPGST